MIIIVPELSCQRILSKVAYFDNTIFVIGGDLECTAEKAIISAWEWKKFPIM